MFTFGKQHKSINDILTQSHLIKVNEDRLHQVVNTFPITKMASEMIIPTGLSFEQKLMFVFVWGLSDFCYWPTPKWGDNQFGNHSASLSACYAQALSDGTDILNPAVMSDFSLRRYRQLTRRESPCSLCFCSIRLLFIRHGMRILRQKYQGSVLTFLKTYQYDAEKIVWALSTEFLGLNDTWLWHNKRVDFLHRAQKITAWWNKIYQDETGDVFLHADQINLGADDKTPWALQRLNILTYAPALKNHIEAQKEIQAGSSVEMMLRMAGMHVINKMKKQLSDNSKPSDNVEQVLWMLAQNEFKKEGGPHKTVTWFY